MSWPRWPGVGAVALLIAGCAPSDHRLGEIFEDLHRPIYGLYALGPDRDALHDLLAASFAGEALTQAYVEHFT
ncbi:MAG: hypothetical protein AAGD38_12935, partial [Acidobacteriota bacterium]